MDRKYKTKYAPPEPPEKVASLLLYTKDEVNEMVRTALKTTLRDIIPALKAAVRDEIVRILPIINKDLPEDAPRLVYLTKTEVAELFRVSEQTITNLTLQGHIRGYRFGGDRILYTNEDVKEALKPVLETRPTRGRRAKLPMQPYALPKNK